LKGQGGCGIAHWPCPDKYEKRSLLCLSLSNPLRQLCISGIGKRAIHVNKRAIHVSKRAMHVNNPLRQLGIGRIGKRAIHVNKRALHSRTPDAQSHALDSMRNVYVCMYVCTYMHKHAYGVAMISRLLKITGLFCRILSLL